MLKTYAKKEKRVEKGKFKLFLYFAIFFKFETFF